MYTVTWNYDHFTINNINNPFFKQNLMRILLSLCLEQCLHQTQLLQSKNIYIYLHLNVPKFKYMCKCKINKSNE